MYEFIMRRCPNCQQEIMVTAKFCRGCGQSLLPNTATRPAQGKTYTLRHAELSLLSQEMTTLPRTQVTQPEEEDPSNGGTIYEIASLDSKQGTNQLVQKGDLLGVSIGGYTITRKLGEGGMGAVYQATHPKGKSIALKVLHPDFTSNPLILQRFFNEAKAVNQIGHPHIIDISDFGYLPNNQPYIAMEFLEGKDLAGRLEARQPLFEAEAIDLTMQVLDALSATHQAGVVHRDLKPENIFLLKSKKDPTRWFVKVLDFGIAKLSQGDTSTKPGTMTGTILGTPPYMSPEQARGESKITYAADLYSLGVILYELLTGRTPFKEANYLGYLVAHQRKTPASPKTHNPRISEATAQVVLRCLAKQPDDRFASAKAMSDALARCLRLLPAALATQTRLQTPPQSNVVKVVSVPVAPLASAVAPRPMTSVVAPVTPMASSRLIAAAREVLSEPELPKSSGWVVPAVAALGIVGVALYFAVL
jgi:serine/threonine protein kinase